MTPTIQIIVIQMLQKFMKSTSNSEQAVIKKKKKKRIKTKKLVFQKNKEKQTCISPH